jgi:hypothetical protein
MWVLLLNNEKFIENEKDFLFPVCCSFPATGYKFLLQRGGTDSFGKE